MATSRACPRTLGSVWGHAVVLTASGVGDIQTPGLMVVSQLWADRRGGSGDPGLPLTAFVLTASRFNPRSTSNPTSVQMTQEGWFWYLQKLRQADSFSSMQLLYVNTSSAQKEHVWDLRPLTLHR